MPLITWNFDKNFFYVLAYWIIENIYRIILSLKGDFFKITNETVHDEYILVISNIISDLLAGFLVLYSKCISKTKKKETDAIRTPSEMLIYTKVDKLKKNFYIKLIIIVVLDYISRSPSWISYAIIKAEPEKVSHALKNNIKITLDIIMRYILSVFILKIEIYRHRIFSIITIGLGFILLIICDNLLIFFDSKSHYQFDKTYLYAAIASIGGFTYPIEDTLIKQIFSKDYLYPANFQFYRGIAESILAIVITLILYFSFGVILKFNTENLNIVIPTIILVTLTGFFKAFVTLKIIYHYSSQSVSFLRIAQSFGGSISIFINFIKNGIDDEWKIGLIILEIIGVLMILFASLIYDEIIIINICELSKNVKLGIINRGEFDIKYMNFFRDSQLDDNQLVANDNNENYSQDKDYNENENNRE